jgi:2-polyprenyl-3-methyl-5-hydroxy-6-metoxy-1,4-benzoquinol methylase
MSIDYYSKNAQCFFDTTIYVDMSALYQAFTGYLKQGSLILDAGCGSGRDTKAFVDMGYQVEAFDACPELVELSKGYTGIDVKLATFNQFEANSRYDGIWACASLLHVPEIDLLTTLSSLASSLKTNGIWYLSFKYGNSEREKEGRLFTDMDEKRFEGLLLQLPQLQLVKSWVTQDNRPDRNEEWLNLVLMKR